MKNFFQKLNELLIQVLIFSYRCNERILARYFLANKFDNFIEIGVHEGEIPRYLSKNTKYFGFEANIHNINKFNLDQFKVQNFACMPDGELNKSVRFNIPLRTEKDARSQYLNSGKGSVLERDLTGWFGKEIIEVPVITPSEILAGKEGTVGVWIDAEGISERLALDFINSPNVRWIHFERDFDEKESLRLQFKSVSKLKGFKQLNARINHDQYNVVLISRFYNPINLFVFFHVYFSTKLLNIIIIFLLFVQNLGSGVYFRLK